MLDVLDKSSLAVLRRTSRLGGLARQARAAELRAQVHELLEITVFPFTHAAYVLGLNGPYYSCDTVADDHYGIPKEMPPLLCELFRSSVPDIPFTTLRIQKLASAANFGGKHRTLAFSLGEPTMGAAAEEQDVRCEVESHQGYIMCLSSSCQGGRCEVCEDLSEGDWRELALPTFAARWLPFPRAAWLQWHWPRGGSFYAIVAICEPASHRRRLSRQERGRMTATGFLLPEGSAPTRGSEGGEVPASDGLNARVDGEPSGAGAASGRAFRPPPRRSEAALAAASRILGLPAGTTASAHDVEEAFRRAVRVVHPDRGAVGDQGPPAPGTAEAAGGLAARTQGWAMAQLTWARRVLREAASVDVDAGHEIDSADGTPTAPAEEQLMLMAPVAPALMDGDDGLVAGGDAA